MMTAQIGQPDLDWSSGAPVSRRFDDIYGARDGGAAESRVVFLQACGLPDRWTNRSVFTVGELGFGTGTNVLALWQMWRAHRQPGKRLHVFSVEGFPLSRDEATRAHMALEPDLQPLATLLRHQWPPQTDGWHRLSFPDDELTLDLAHLPVETALSEWSGCADAWFLDGFAPAKNPDMWSDAVFGLIAGHSTPDARVGTFTVAGPVRRGLSDAGFTVSKHAGYGRKRERLEATLSGTLTANPPPSPSVAVIGAGIAGAWICHHLQARGIIPLWFDPLGRARAASGNPVGLVSPRLDRGHTALARFYAQSYRHAVAAYNLMTPDAITHRGLLRLATTPRDAERFSALIALKRYSSTELSMLSPLETADRLGFSGDHAGFWLADALSLKPTDAIATLTRDVNLRHEHVQKLSKAKNGWRVETDQSSYTVDAVIVANGASLSGLVSHIPIIPTRGQISVATGQLPCPVSWGGYAVPMANGEILFGASHVADDPSCDLRPAEDDHNRAVLQKGLGRFAATIGATTAMRAGIRAATRDRLPICGTQGDGLFVLGGLGSRGLTFAPLLAESVVADLLTLPSPLAQPVLNTLSPLRFTAAHSER